ncbi:hypothetical protein NDU88_001979 [Pleurodeles waltl]|uniref:Myb/SANT-like DNA-binding domain-containing protein n=1 Tax=Pleurodeles waltl TaxID=8319 RepID=A0AAV7VD16_PLEWA|nr:hypothetical protein NDU88_001979 [Pleurodeles waltl]
MNSGSVKPVCQYDMSFLHCRLVYQRSVHGKIPPSPRMSQRTVPMKDNREHRVNQPTGEDLHCKCCCDLGLEETMAHANGERAPAFTAQELEKLVDGVLPQYALLYGLPDQQVSAHQKIDIWRAIAKDVRALGVHHRRGTHCRKRWEDIRRWSRKTVEAQLGMASQRGRGASRTLTPLMSRILAVAYPDLDGRVRTSQQTQGGGGEVASEHEGAASHMALEGHRTDSEYTSGTEGEGSSTAGTRADISDTDSSSEGSSLVVAATSVPPTTTGTAANQRTSTALPAAPQRLPRACSPRKVGISFAPGTSGPAPVTPAALSEEIIDLLRTLTVGQSTILNAIQGVEREVQYSPLSSAPAFVLLVEEQKDNRWEDVEFGFHAVQIPRGVYGGERFPFEMAVSAMFLSAGLPPRKRWRIGVL